MSAKDILCTYFYTNNFNRFKVITLTISNYGETWGGYFKTNNMKTLTFTYELLKFMLISVPLASLIYVTAIVLTELKRVIK